MQQGRIEGLHAGGVALDALALKELSGGLVAHEQAGKRANGHVQARKAVHVRPHGIALEAGRLNHRAFAFLLHGHRIVGIAGQSSRIGAPVDLVHDGFALAEFHHVGCGVFLDEGVLNVERNAQVRVGRAGILLEELFHIHDTPP